MDTILVLTDFSDAAFHAAEYARAISGPLGAKRIVLYHTYEVFVPNPADMPSAILGQVNYSVEGTYDPEYDRLLMEANEKMLEQIKTRLADPALALQIEYGTGNMPLGGSVNELIAEYDAGLVVMGTTGKDFIGQLLIGGNTARVADAAECPVLIVPVQAETGPVSRVVLACDLTSPLGNLPLQGLENILDGFNASLRVVSVGHGDTFGNATEMAQSTGLFNLLKKYQPSFAFIDNKDTVAGIMEYAIEQQASMVVVIRKNHGFFHDLFHKSVTHQLAHHTFIPLLVLHEKEPAV